MRNVTGSRDKVDVARLPGKVDQSPTRNSIHVLITSLSLSRVLCLRTIARSRKLAVEVLLTGAFKIDYTTETPEHGSRERARARALLHATRALFR